MIQTTRINFGVGLGHLFLLELDLDPGLQCFFRGSTYRFAI